MDVMMRRRELMGMQGVLKTVSAPIVTVSDAMARNAKSLIVNFAPVQAAGTPAPDNVLPISGWTGVSAYVSPTLDAQDGTTYPVDWTDTAGTVYGGYVDLVSGVLTATWVKKNISDFTWSYSTYNSANAFRTDPLDIIGNSPEQGVMCSAFASESMVANYAGSANKPNHTVYRLYTTQERRIFVKCTEYTGVSDFLAAYGNEEIAYKLDTPITYQLTPQTVAMLKGTNNVWANVNGNVSLTYYAQ